MDLPDVNVLVYAHREEMDRHVPCRQWLENLIYSGEAYGMSDLVLSGFVRVVTNPKIFSQPSPLEAALEFACELRNQPQAAIITPGPQQWEYFLHLVQETNARGNHIPDAYFAAMAIESDCRWITFDQGFSRYPGLTWERPY